MWGNDGHYPDPDERELAKSGYWSPFTAFSPDDRLLPLDGLRVKPEPCPACGVGSPIMEALLFEPVLPVPEVPCDANLDKVSPGTGSPLYWRCPECGHADHVRLDRFASR